MAQLTIGQYHAHPFPPPPREVRYIPNSQLSGMLSSTLIGCVASPKILAQLRSKSAFSVKSGYCYFS